MLLLSAPKLVWQEPSVLAGFLILRLSSNKLIGA